MTGVDPQLVSGLGAAASVFLASTGSALASAHGGIFALRRGQQGKDWKYFVPVVQAGVLSIYGLIVAILVVGKLGGGEEGGEGTTAMSAADGYRYLTAGLANGLGCWASGWGMAKFISMLNNEQPPPPQTVNTTTAAGASSPSAGALESSSSSQQEPLLGTNKSGSGSSSITVKAAAEKAEFRQIVLALIFLEAIGLYGFIVACVLIMKK